MLVWALHVKKNVLICASTLFLVGFGLLASLEIAYQEGADLPVSQIALSSLNDTYQSGVSAYRQGDYQQASAYMRQVLEQQPMAVNAHYYLAVCQDLLGNDKEALPHYQWVSEGVAEKKIKTYAKQRIEVLKNRIRQDKLAGNLSLAGISQAVPVVSAYQKGKLGIVPLKHSKNALMIDATLVNAKTGKRVQGTFILDTGATYTSISEEMADMLGIDTSDSEKVRITTANGRIDVPKVVLDKIQIEGVEAQQVPATIIRVRPDSSFSGLLGLSFIRQFKMTIDPVANQLVFETNLSQP